MDYVNNPWAFACMSGATVYSLALAPFQTALLAAIYQTGFSRITRAS